MYLTEEQKSAISLEFETFVDSMYVGKTKKEAISMVKNFNIEYSGSGDYVVEQSPSGGSRILENGKVRLLSGNESGN